MLQVVLLSLVCCALSQGKSLDDHGNVGVNNPFASGLPSILSHLARRMPDLATTFKNDLGMTPEQQRAFHRRVNTAEWNSRAASEQCDDCVTPVETLKAVVDIGFEFEDLRDLAVDICIDLITDSSDWNGPEFCPGTIDNFGPHVVYVLKNVDYTGEEICLKWNECTPDDIPYAGRYYQEHLPAERYPHRPGPKGSSPAAQKPDLQNALKLVHITDIHVEEKYVEGSVTDCGFPVCCREDFEGTGSAGRYGDYACNIPPRTVELFLNFMAEMQPDLVAYTGDNPPHALWLETQQGQLNVTRWTADAIKRNFPGVPTFPTIGNHETYPTNLYFTQRPEIQEFNTVYGEVWQGLAGFEQEQLDTIQDGGYYSLMVQPGLRLLSYNSNYGVTENFYNLLNEDGEDFARMKQFMEDTLKNARDSGDKVLLLGHHMTGGGGTFLHYSRFMTQLLAEYGDIITLHLLGHSHSDNFRMVTDPLTGEVYNVQLSGPSVTSHTDINPSARVFYLDRDTLEPLDQETYYLDLQAVVEGRSEDPEIQLSYRATEEYNMADLSPASFKAFVDRMETEDELVAKYRYNLETRTGFEGPCDADCRKSLLCTLRTSSIDRQRLCYTS